MKQMTSEVKQQQLEWRRSQVLELASEGYTQREIANKLQVDLTAVNRHPVPKTTSPRESSETYPRNSTRRISEMYDRYEAKPEKQTLEIAESAADPKTKLQARAIANDCYKYIMDLTTNGVIVTEALKYVTQKTEQVNTLQKLDEKAKSKSAV
jgi:predicted transcriptional regulator